MKSLLAQLNQETFVFDLDRALDTEPDLSPYRMTHFDGAHIEVEVDRADSINGLFKIFEEGLGKKLGLTIN